MAQEGVLGRTSCRSWVSWACWGGMRAVERQPTPEKMRLLRRLPCSLCAATAKTSAGVMFLEVHGRYSRSLLCLDSSELDHHNTP